MHSRTQKDNQWTRATSGGRLTPKQQRLKMVALIAAYIRKTGDWHPSRESILRIQQQFKLETINHTQFLIQLARNQLKRKSLTASQRSLVRECIASLPPGHDLAELHQIVKERTNVDGLDFHYLVRQYSAQLELRTMPRETLSTLKLHIEKSVDSGVNYHDLLDDLERLTEGRVSRHSLAQLVRVCKRRVKLSHVTETQHKIIESHVKASESSFNTPLLCDELESDQRTQLPRQTLVYLVHLAQMKLVTDEEKRIVFQHVSRAPTRFRRNPSVLVSQLIQKINLPRRILSRLVHQACYRHAQFSLSQVQRDLIAQHVRTSQHTDASTLCNELQSDPRLKLPRRTLLRLIHNAQLECVSEEKRHFVQDYVNGASEGLCRKPRLITAQLLDKVDLPKVVLHKLVRQACDRHFWHSVTEEQRDLIRQHVQSSAHDDPSRLCDELQSQTQLPRSVLTYWIVHAQIEHVSDDQRRIVDDFVRNVPVEMRDKPLHLVTQLLETTQIPTRALNRLVRQACDRYNAHSLTQEQRDFAIQHVQASEHGSVSSLCDELQTQINVPRRALYELVRSVKRKNVTPEQRSLVRDYVRHSPRPLDVQSICDELQERLPDVIRHQLRVLVRNCCISVERESVLTPELRQRVEEHVADSEHPDNVPLLCDELLEKLRVPVSRSSLYAVVHNASRHHCQNAKITKEQREMVHEYVLSEPHPLNVQHICANLRARLPNATMYQLNSLVRSICVSMESESLTPEVRQTIVDHVAASKHPNKFPLLCDELQDKLSIGISRSTLYAVVQKAVKNHAPSARMSPEQREIVREYVLGASRPLDVRRICDELHGQFAEIPRSQLNTVVRNSIVSVELERITPMMRRMIDEHVRDSTHRDTAQLCDELQGKLGVGVFRRALYMVVDASLRKQSKQVSV